MQKIFAVCAPGLEPLLARELAALGLLRGGAGKTVPPEDLDGELPESTPTTSRTPTSAPESAGTKDSSGAAAAAEGGIEFEGEIGDVFRANLRLRTATRVLLRLSTIQARTLDQIVEKVATMPWKFYLRPGQPVAVRATCRRSKIYHTDAVAERVAEGIGERLGVPTPLKRFHEESDAKDAPRLIVARIVNDRCTLSVDTSGASLHRRGYRQATAKAPLRETLAAAMLLASGWDAASPLLDPFCGSGTIAIEAALLALGIAPGAARRFAFMDWPSFDKPLWQKILDEADAARRTSPPPIILASDRDAGAIQSARENAVRAAVADHIQFSECAVSAVEPPPGPGWIVTNPPYGVRIAGKSDLRNLYAKFGAVARAKCPGWGVVLLSSHPQLAHATGLAFDEGLPLRNGGLRIRLVRARVDSTPTE